MILFLVPELGWRPGKIRLPDYLSIQTSPMSNNSKATIEEGWTSDLVGTMSGEGVVETYVCRRQGKIEQCAQAAKVGCRCSRPSLTLQQCADAGAGAGAKACQSLFPVTCATLIGMSFGLRRR
jgi:hypothetical protein